MESHSETSPTRTNVLRQLIREATRLDRSGVAFAFGTRCAIGVAVPLIAAIALHYPLAGLSAAIGALAAGFASRQGAYRTRVAAMLTTTLAVALSGFVGALVGPSAWASIIVYGLWGAAIGFTAVLGVTAQIVGVNAVVALAVFGHPPYHPSQALPQALLAVAGGAWQTLLLVVIWPLQRFPVERRAVAAEYRGLAQYAVALPTEALVSPASQPFADAAHVFEDPHPFGGERALLALESEHDEAGRARALLAALATDHHLLTQRGLTEAAANVAALAKLSASVDEELADALLDGRAPKALDETWHTLDLYVKALEPASRRDYAVAQAVDHARSLLAALRTAWRAAQVAADRVAASPARPRIGQPFSLSELGVALATLRANLSPQSAYAHHAMRMAVTLVIAAALERVLAMSGGYWIPLTAVLVLRPEFTTTFARGLARIAGTIVGAALATVIADVLRPAPLANMALAIVFAALSYIVIAANYLLFSVAITGYVVFVLAYAGAAERTTVVDRIIATVIGGALALVVYAARPTWSRQRTPGELGAYLEMLWRLAMGEMRIDPELCTPGAVDAARSASWRARSAAEAAVDQMLAEPARPTVLARQEAVAILAAIRRFGIAVLTLGATTQGTIDATEPAVRTLIDQLDEAIHIIVDALRDGDRQPHTLPPLRATQAEIKRRFDEAPNPNLAALVSETDLMVESVEAIAEILWSPNEVPK